MKKLTIVGAGIFAAVLAGVAAWPPSSPPLAGFTAAAAKAHLDAERRFMAMPSTDRIRGAHLFLTDKPHMAGSERNRELAEWTRDEFVTYGLEDVRMVIHEVLLPWPEEVSVEMTTPRAWKASMREDPIDGDRYTQVSEEEVGIPYHAYSASGEVTAPVVYAGSGNPADYEALAKRGIDIRGKIALVRYSVPYSYRGFKALTAERLGAAGILIYSDIEDSGSLKGPVYPDGPWGPDSTIQRGGIVYDFMVPGDPLTPGWASVPGAKRIERSEAVSLPKIISAPLSYRDARVILETLGDPHRKKDDWTPPADLPVVRMKVKLDDEIRPIQTVTGMIRGSERPEELVILGNHRDAWVYGGVDPSSGSAAMMELARSLGELAKAGWRPKRSILFASWDAEEFTLTSSTEWGEQFQERLKQSAVAYLNVDSAASGPHFSAAAVPALNALIAEVSAAVPDPRTRKPIADVSRERSAAERGSLSPAEATAALVNNRLGSGSDYTVFLNFLGVPVADLKFDGPYGVYHSMYDNHDWVAKIGDPGFQYSLAMTQIWGLLAMRLANADVIPLDYEPYARTIAGFIDDVGTRGAVEGWDDVRRAAQAMLEAAEAFNQRRGEALRSGDADAMRDLNARLLRVERGLLDPAGIPGRPWYRHQIYAPKYTYAPELLPGVAEAIDAGDAARASAQAKALAAALHRAAEALR
jgi:N-acetylated-alpha-linked acidic dipeptidase